MSTWVLVLVMTLSNRVGTIDADLTAIPGYETRDACREAGLRYAEAWPRRADWHCIPGPKR